MYLIRIIDVGNDGALPGVTSCYVGVPSFSFEEIRRQLKAILEKDGRNDVTLERVKERFKLERNKDVIAAVDTEGTRTIVFMITDE